MQEKDRAEPDSNGWGEQEHERCRKSACELKSAEDK
jgi:hypothetical protein